MTNRNRQPWRPAAAARDRTAGLGAALAPAARVAMIAGIGCIACIVCIAAIACVGCGRGDGGGTRAGGPAAPAAAGSPAAGSLPDACELLTEADVETITREVSGSLSSTLEDAVGKDPGQCTFSLAGSVPPRVISLALRRAASVEQAAARQQADESGLRSLGSGAPVEDLPRLGDGAFWIGGQIDQLHVRRGDTLLVFTVQVDKDPLRAASTLADKALARLAKPAPPAARPAGGSQPPRSGGLP